MDGRQLAVGGPRLLEMLSIDLPAIGPATIANALKAGIGVVAVQASASLLIQRSRHEAAANAAQIAIVGVSNDDA